jgi:transcriptional regulator with XRE-family HTH domain
MSKFTKDIGKRLYLARIEKKLTQEELAILSKVSDNTISLIENGDVNTGFVNIYKLCRALKLPLVELYKGY